MAPAIVVAHPGQDGDPAAGRATVEYEKILRLRDQIFAGTHPRLKLPAASGQQATTALNPPHGALKSVLPNGLHAEATASQHAASDHLQPSHGSSLAPPSITPASSSYKNASNGLLVPSPRGGTSSLDPIFLTKSDELIRAEIRLERQRIERSLQEQVQEKRDGSKQNRADQEALPEFDVSEVFFQAQELVKPLPPETKTTVPGPSSPHRSLDESTCYSSQVDEPAPDGRDGSGSKHRSKPCRYFFAGSCKKGADCTYSHHPAFRRQLEQTDKSDAPVDPSRERSQGQRRPHLERQPSPPLLGDDHLHGASLGNGWSGNADHAWAGPTHGSEPAYQPQHGQVGGKHYDLEKKHIAHGSPGFRTTRNESNARRSDMFPPEARARSPVRASAHDRVAVDAGRTSPTPRDGRIVRSHITSPVAPQPARVSPLAVAKLPRIDQAKRDDEVLVEAGSGHSKSNDHSPGMVMSNPRKRRHEVEATDTARNVLQRRVAKSSPPYIKEEPISPPPFSVLPPQEYDRYERDERRPLILRSPPPHAQERGFYRPVERAYIERAEVRRASSPMVRRAISRAGQRYEIRDEPELRRVFSSQQPRRATPPYQDQTIYSIPPTPTSYSPAYAKQAEPERRATHWTPLPPVPSVSRSRIARSPEVQQIRYAPIERGSTLMAPPPRRIVFDQSGAEYYEAAPPLHPSTMQPAPKRATVRSSHGAEYRYSPGIPRIVSPEPASPKYVEYASAPRPMRPRSRVATYEPREEVYRPVTSSYDGRVDWRRASVRPATEQVYQNARLVRTMPSPEPVPVQYVEYPAETPMMRALSRAPVVEARHEIYGLRGDPSYGTYVDATPEDLVRRRGSPSRMESSRPLAVPYPAPRQLSRTHMAPADERPPGMSLRMPMYAREEVQSYEGYGRGLEPENLRPQYEYATKTGQA